MCKYAYTIFLSAIIWADLKSISGNSWWHTLCNQRKKNSASVWIILHQPNRLIYAFFPWKKWQSVSFRLIGTISNQSWWPPLYHQRKIFQFQLIYTSSAKLADSCIFPWKKCQIRQFWTDLLPSALMADGPICTQWENVSKMLIHFFHQPKPLIIPDFYGKKVPSTYNLSFT